MIITRHTSAILGFSYLFGLICASFVQPTTCLAVVITLLALAVGVSAVASIDRFEAAKKGCAVASACLFTLGAAFGVMGIYNYLTQDTLEKYADDTVIVQGRIESKSNPANDMATYIITAELDGRRTRMVLHAQDKEVKSGDRVTFEGNLKRYENSADFAAENYYRSKGILLRATATDFDVQKSDVPLPSHYISQYNTYLKNQIVKKMPNDYGGLLIGIFLGDKGKISPELRNSLTRAGVGHFSAVSGMQLTVIMQIFMLGLELTPLRRRRVPRFFLLCGILLILVVFFNLSTSLIRAAIMLAVYYGGELVFRRGSPLDSVGIALLCILIVSPYACLDSGLLLSVSGILGVAVVAPKVHRLFKGKRLVSLRNLVLSSLTAIICTLPVTLVVFGGMSMVGVLTNVLAQPFLQIMLTMMVLFGVSGGVVDGLLIIAGFMSKCMVKLVNFFGGIPNAYIKLDYQFIVPLVAVSVGFVLLVWIFFRAGNKVYKSVLMTVCMLFFMTTTAYCTEPPYMQVYSDGDAGVALLYDERQVLIVVAMNDSRTTYSYIESYLKDNFHTKATVLCLLESTDNNEAAFQKLPTQHYLPPNEGKNTQLEIDGRYLLNVGNGTAELDFGTATIYFGNVKSPPEKYHDISVMSGYKLSDLAPNCGAAVFLHKRQQTAMITDYKIYNAYFEKVKISF